MYYSVSDKLSISHLLVIYIKFLNYVFQGQWIIFSPSALYLSSVPDNNISR